VSSVRRAEASDDAADPLVSIQIAKDYLGFSAGHFTIFSATERERLHGHNFRLKLELQAEVDENGLTFDYVPLKQQLKKWCDELDERVLLPMYSPHLSVRAADASISVCVEGQTMVLPLADVLLLPVRNTTVEDLSHYFLKRLLKLKTGWVQKVRRLKLGISSGRGQWGVACWSAK